MGRVGGSGTGAIPVNRSFSFVALSDESGMFLFMDMKAAPPRATVHTSGSPRFGNVYE